MNFVHTHILEHRSPAKYFREKLKGPSIMNYYPREFAKDEMFFHKLRTLGLWADERLVCHDPCVTSTHDNHVAGLERPRQGHAEQARQGAAEERWQHGFVCEMGVRCSLQGRASGPPRRSSFSLLRVREYQLVTAINRHY